MDSKGGIASTSSLRKKKKTHQNGDLFCYDYELSGYLCSACLRRYDRTTTRETGEQKMIKYRHNSISKQPLTVSVSEVCGDEKSFFFLYVMRGMSLNGGHQNEEKSKASFQQM